MCTKSNVIGTNCFYVWLLFIAHCKVTVPQITLPPIHHSHVDQFLERAHQQMDEVYMEFNKNIYNKGTRQTPGSPAWYMSISHSMKPVAYNLSHASLVVEEATRYMAEAYALSKEQIAYALSEMDISQTAMGKTCLMTLDKPCEARKYRAFSGYCNNVQNPRWGNAYTKYARLLMPAYEDGVSLPRGGGISSRMTLPGARDVSLAVHVEKDRDRDRQHEHLAAMTVVWGQFISHDISHTPFATGYNGAKLKCCGVNFNEFHPECFPIKLSESDLRTSQRRERCQEFVRSASVVRTGCSLGPREQLNQATSFLDGSPVYGNSRSEADLLREFQGGRLKMQNFQGRKLMPKDDDVTCRNNGTDQHCFLSGDVRANENVGLATLYTLWLREHNRIASELALINPHWNDETLFQETRRITIAELQHITYNEFLPTILSQTVIDKFDLKLAKIGYFLGYNINKNPSTLNSVAHAAIWYTATLLPDVLILPNPQVAENSLKFSGTFFAPFELYQEEGFENILQGMLQSPTQKDDSVINHVMTNDMFKDTSYKGAGLDLAAQIIQRGRDHGLPSYTEWRKFCGLKTVNTFQDLTGITTPKIKNIFQKIYRNVTDIDLFTGGLSEISMLGSVIGPTFSCLLGHQFHATKFGDRHWYENNVPPSSFKPLQLQEIRKVTLSRLICDNSDVAEIQTNAFLRADLYLNEKMSCKGSTIQKLNLNHWRHDSSQILMDTQLLKSFLTQAQNDIKEIYQNENLHSVANSPVLTAFKFNRPKRQAAIIANMSLLLQLTSARIVDNYIQSFQDQESTKKNVNDEELRQLMSALPEIDLTSLLHIPQNFQCDEIDLPCDHTTPYRSVTGRCNNLNNAEFGKSMRSFNRLLNPAYDDGIGSPRQTSVTGIPLPSARLISSNLHPDFSSPHRRYSLMLMQMAQIVDHDLTHTPVNVKHIGPGVLDCSSCANTASGCIPIPIPPKDPYFPNRDPSTGQSRCIPVTRSLPSRLTLGYREQMNQVTAYLDCSFIYGSDTCEMKQLRMFSGGRLNVTNRVNAKPLMPETPTNPECRSDSKICFRAGDLRASEQPGLASLHTVFLREHNRIAEELSKINRHWTDEELYQQTRRIIIAQTEHIIFSELLPRIFGWEQLEKYGLSLQPSGYFTGYDQKCDATLVNEFSAAAYRFGHSLLRPVFKRMNNKHAAQEPEIRLRDHFFNPALLYHENMIDELLMGLAGTPMETLDQFVTGEVTNHLFEDKDIAFSGMDLPAINIQRARDHGIPGYNRYRKFCNLTKAETFKDLQDLIPPSLVETLKHLYVHVDDIDLFPGGLVETPLKGGIIGPTIACIVGNQFRKLRMCDRFWYENDNPFTRFTLDQLGEIRKTTLSRLVCDNTNIVTVQKSLLDLPDPFLNPRVPCRNFEPLNLDFWKEQRRCFIKETIIEVGNYEKISPCVTCICTKEGIICESLRVDNCFRLAEIHSWDSILKDAVCKVQCAHAFSTLPLQQNTTRFLRFT